MILDEGIIEADYVIIDSGVEHKRFDQMDVEEYEKYVLEQMIAEIESKGYTVIKDGA